MLYAFLPRRVCLSVMVFLGGLIVLLEWVRHRYPVFNAWGWDRFGGLARAWEKDRISGVFWTWLGSFLTMLIFARREVALAALAFMIFGDAAAALVGGSWGRHPWPGRPGKSVEGSVAFALAATLCGLCFLPPRAVILSALTAAWMESHRLPWDDNLWIPLLSGACLSLAR